MDEKTPLHGGRSGVFDEVLWASRLAGLGLPRKREIAVEGEDTLADGVKFLHVGRIC